MQPMRRHANVRFVVVSIALLVVVVGPTLVVVVLAVLIIVIVRVLALMAVAIVVLASLRMSGHLEEQLECDVEPVLSCQQNLISRKRHGLGLKRERSGVAYLKQCALGTAGVELILPWRRRN